MYVYTTKLHARIAVVLTCVLKCYYVMNFHIYYDSFTMVTQAVQQVNIILHLEEFVIKSYK